MGKRLHEALEAINMVGERDEKGWEDLHVLAVLRRADVFGWMGMGWKRHLLCRQHHRKPQNEHKLLDGSAKLESPSS